MWVLFLCMRHSLLPDEIEERRAASSETKYGKRSTTQHLIKSSEINVLYFRLRHELPV